jgi:nucleoside-diphosphate-sugar epimerase
MRILVIGGSKFIGWRFVELLGSTDHEVTVINRGNHPREYPANAVHHEADRNDAEKMAAIISDTVYDAVFDMCGFVENDMKYTAKLFSGHAKKYVFISTAATYLEPVKMPISEDAPQGIHQVWGAYGGGKLACERVLLAAYKESDFPAVIVRPSYVYGTGNTIDRETFLFDRITKGRTILLPNGGEAVLQLGEVTDLCRALLSIAETPSGIGESYNISGSEYITLNGLVRLVAGIVGKEAKTIAVNPKEYSMTDRDIFPFDDISYFTDCTKFSRDLNWFPQSSLLSGLTHTYKEWLNSSEKLPTNYEKEDSILAIVGNEK